jgi:hypothetical protein
MLFINGDQVYDGFSYLAKCSRNLGALVINEFLGAFTLSYCGIVWPQMA